MTSAPMTFKKSSMGTPHKGPSEEQQLRRDRITAIVVLAVLAALIGLMIWLGSLGGNSMPVEQYWPMMP